MDGKDGRRAEREVSEELGLDLSFADTEPIFSFRTDSRFDDYWMAVIDSKTPLRLQPEEVQAVRWATEDEILQMIDDGRFIPYEKSQISLLFFRRNHRSSHTKSDWTGR